MALHPLSMDPSAKEGFYCQVSSNQDDNYLIASIYHGESIICHVDTEVGEFRVDFPSGPYINYNQASVHANLNDFLRILELAQTELRKYPNGLHVK